MNHFMKSISLFVLALFTAAMLPVSAQTQNYEFDVAFYCITDDGEPKTLTLNMGPLDSDNPGHDGGDGGDGSDGSDGGGPGDEVDPDFVPGWVLHVTDKISGEQVVITIQDRYFGIHHPSLTRAVGIETGTNDQGDLILHYRIISDQMTGLFPPTFGNATPEVDTLSDSINLSQLTSSLRFELLDLLNGTIAVNRPTFLNAVADALAQEQFSYEMKNCNPPPCFQYVLEAAATSIRFMMIKGSDAMILQELYTHENAVTVYQNWLDNCSGLGNLSGQGF